MISAKVCIDCFQSGEDACLCIDAVDWPTAQIASRALRATAENPCGGCKVEWVDGYSHGWFHGKKGCPDADLLRDSWTTPLWFTDLIAGLFTLDPCSNERSTVRAARSCCLPDENGLLTSWEDEDVFVNGPYSDLMPWAKKAGEARAFAFLVNLDPTTGWHKELRKNGGVYRFEFDKRIKFSPPPHIRESTNSRPQALICNWECVRLIDGALRGFGSWHMEISADGNSPFEDDQTDYFGAQRGPTANVDT